MDNHNRSRAEETRVLEEEARYFYQKIFKKPPPPDMAERYLKANRRLLEENEITALRETVNRQADIEALEMAWRRRDPANLLTRKIHILVYLAETTPRNYETFINLEDRRAVSPVSLSFHFFRTLYKFVKGRIILKRYTIERVV